MPNKPNSYIIDVNSDLYSENFKKSFALYVNQVKSLHEALFSDYYAEITENEIMGTMAAEICPDLKRRMDSPQSGEKRGENEWNAFRHFYKDELGK